MKILIAHDGSPGADEAINDLPRAGMPGEAEALIINIKELWLPHFSKKPEINHFVASSTSSAAKYAPALIEMPIDAPVEQLKILNLAAELLHSKFPDWKTEKLHLTGSPAREILDQTKVWGADLVIVGSNGSMGSKQYVLGSVSQKIANEANCSVRVVRGESWKNGSPSRLLIALDGTTSSLAAVTEVTRRMWSMGSEVRLLIVQDSLQDVSGSVCEYVEDAKKHLIAADLSVTELIEEGDPKQLIVSAAEEWGADCIFLGANGSGRFYEDLLLGSVSTAVVARAHCTVEIVRKKMTGTTPGV
ncbi:MAG: universal stress protein [Acidobacteriota bacterium]